MNEYEGYAIVVLGELVVNAQNNQPTFMIKTYGPYGTLREAEESLEMVRAIEGVSATVRPLCNVGDALRRMSAD